MTTAALPGSTTAVGYTSEQYFEALRDADPGARTYRTRAVVRSGARLTLVALPGLSAAIDDLLPARWRPAAAR